jgi:23S rRNA (adenine2503-C2)-methyltransferase
MYFANLSTQFKPYKLKILNKYFFQDILSDFEEMTSLSIQERKLLVENLQKEIDETKNIKSVTPLRTGSGSLISRKAQTLVKHNFLAKLDSLTEQYIYAAKNLHFELVKLLFDEESQTWKALFKLQDGKKIESVLMRFQDGRNSVCVSSQVGCPVGCAFCASGQMGFFRNLTSHEIVDQVLFWCRLLKNLPNDNNDKKFSKVAISNANSFERVTNIVYMGMGEPMLNYENVVNSVKILTNPEEFGLGDRHITVSSSGYIPQLEKYMNEGLKTRLAISLHAPNQKVREQLMPVAKVYSLDRLLDFCKKYEEYSHKRISYEYTLIRGVNDTEEAARDLVRLLRHRDAHVNLIPMNPIAERKDLQKSEIDSIYKFFDILQKYKIPSTIRITMGDKIQAACGQLVNLN